jgi:hypothetical protein
VLSETGRTSNAAVFLVGVFSGSEELARGTLAGPVTGQVHVVGILRGCGEGDGDCSDRQ